MATTKALKTMFTTYLNNESKIEDLAKDLKELRKIKKTVVKDIVATMKEAGETEIQVGERTFSLTHGLGVSKK